MKDRVAGAPGQYKATVAGAEFNKLQNGEPFAITLQRDDKPEVEGTPYSKAAVLPDHVSQKICPGMENPTPADAFDALATEIGEKLKAYSINIGNPAFEGKYVTVSEEEDLNEENGGEAYDGFAEKEGCCVYCLYSGGLEFPAGMTVRIRTYMYGNMAIYKEEWPDIEDDSSRYITNAYADIDADPKSGIFEYSVTIPHNDSSLLWISFCENPYLDKPVVYFPKETVWDSIRKIESNNAIASGRIDTSGIGSISCYYQSSVAMTQCWGFFNDRVDIDEYGSGSIYFDLPVPVMLMRDYSPFVSVCDRYGSRVMTGSLEDDGLFCITVFEEYVEGALNSIKVEGSFYIAGFNYLLSE